MVVKVFDNTYDYYLGYEYLLKKYPNDIHMISAFELTSFKKTILMLQYDFHGTMDLNPLDGNEIERFVYYSESEVKGVAIRAYFEEYTFALDYEEYIIVIADNPDVFHELLNKSHKRKGKYEIITFRVLERTFLGKKCGEATVHSWKVYLVKANESFEKMSEIEYEPFSNKYIDKVKGKEADETNPLRYYMFAQNGIEGYSSWVYLEGGNPIMVASVLPYIDGVPEVKLFMIENAISQPKIAVRFLEGIIKIAIPQCDKAVLRIKCPCTAIKSLLNTGRFKNISEEQHLHLEE